MASENKKSRVFFRTKTTQHNKKNLAFFNMVQGTNIPPFPQGKRGKKNYVLTQINENEYFNNKQVFVNVCLKIYSLHKHGKESDAMAQNKHDNGERYDLRP